MRCDAHDVLPSISKGSRNRRVGPVSGGGYRLRDLGSHPQTVRPTSQGGRRRSDTELLLRPGLHRVPDKIVFRARTYEFRHREGREQTSLHGCLSHRADISIQRAPFQSRLIQVNQRCATLQQSARDPPCAGPPPATGRCVASARDPGRRDAAASISSGSGRQRLELGVVRPHLGVSSAFGGRDLELMNGLVLQTALRCR